jgi:uracil-DNA glycosylase
VHDSGVPFSDASGRRLREWMGIDEATFYDTSRIAIVPMGLCFPGTGACGDLSPHAECAPAWRLALFAALPRVELTLVVGRYARD